MDNNKIISGNHETIASNIMFTSRVDLGDSTVRLAAEGCGQGTGTGTLDLSSNGTIIAQAGDAAISLATNLAQETSIGIDGGPLGSVTICNSLPAGNSQTVQLDSMKQSIEVTNGNVPGAMQSIMMDGLTQSIEMSAGGLPVSPTIQMSPMGIKLSVGPTNSIEITPEGVTISGLMIAIQGVAQTDVEGALVNVQSEAVTAIKGALVQIN